MPKNLVIVESPAKANTVARYLGSDFEVKSTYGHIRDLPKKDFGVDIAKGFKPTYVVSPEKKQVVSELKKAAAKSTVWLASDEDREGEAIAWHTCILLGLDPDKTNRLVFHEITKPAITEAIAKPRTIDHKLVDAQQARRILDRIVGYELSPILWKKIRAGLSAGRVQSVAVRLIVEREREIKDFKTEGSFKVSALFLADGHDMPAELTQKKPDAESAKKFLEDIKDSSFKVKSAEQKPGTRSPAPPFITSTLQQEAARRLGFGVKQTMVLAQRLYEAGHITYMRTDSTNLSNIAIAVAKEYIHKNFGAKYSHSRQYQTRSRMAQEAHEAIRPTAFTKQGAGADKAQQKLYDLIWKRAAASQMAAAQVDKTEVAITISGKNEEFLARGELLNFDGFLKVYPGAREDQILPTVEAGQALELKALTATETFSKPPARYSEANLVRRLEELGIGRPSTYAPTISTIQDRQYIEKKDISGETLKTRLFSLKDNKVVEESQETTVGADRNKLVPTPLGEIVTDFLVKYFKSIVDYEFTARAEESFDDIADGKLKWPRALEQFYEDFHPLIAKAGQASRSETLQVRELGKDPKSGLPVLVRYARYGPVLQLGATPDSSDKKAAKPRFAPLPPDSEMENVTLEQSLPMFNLPRQVGKTTDGQAIIANIGPYGPYISVAKQFISLKEHSPLTITEAEAKKLIEQHKNEEKQKVIADFGKIKVLRGFYGPYVTDSKNNARIPKKFKPEELNEQQARQLLLDKQKNSSKKS